MSCIFSSRIIYLIANNKSSVYIFLNTRVLLHSIITGCHGIWTCNEMVAVGIMQSLLSNEHIHILIAPNLKLLPTILTIKLPKSGNLWRRKLILKLSSLWNVKCLNSTLHWNANLGHLSIDPIQCKPG